MSNSAGKRRKKDGFTVPMLAFRCHRCKRGLNLSPGEAQPLKEGKVAYCYDCLAEGHVIEMTVTKYRSGPIDLRI